MRCVVKIHDRELVDFFATLSDGKHARLVEAGVQIDRKRRPIGRVLRRQTNRWWGSSVPGSLLDNSFPRDMAAHGSRFDCASSAEWPAALPVVTPILKFNELCSRCFVSNSGSSDNSAWKAANDEPRFRVAEARQDSTDYDCC